MKLLLAVLIVFINPSSSVNSILLTCEEDNQKIVRIEFKKVSNIKSRAVFNKLPRSDFRTATYALSVECATENRKINSLYPTFYFEYSGEI